jgi:hypothetical protein
LPFQQVTLLLAPAHSGTGTVEAMQPVVGVIVVSHATAQTEENSQP